MEQSETSKPTAEIDTAAPDETALLALKSLVQTGNLKEARQRAETLLKDHPASSQLHNILGIVALSSGELEKSVPSFRRALDLAPDFTGAAANLGAALMKLNQNDAAIEVLTKAVELEPGAIQARANLANAHLNAKQHREAFDQSTELLARVPGNPDFLKIRATAAAEIADWPSVLDALEKIEAASGVSDWSVRTRFPALTKSGRVEDAVAYGETNAGTYPSLATPFGELLVELGRFEEARHWLLKAIRNDPDDAMAYFHYGKIRRWTEDDPLLDDLKATAARFERTKKPDGAPVFFALAKANMDLKKHDEVFPALRKANEIQGKGWRYDLDAQKAQAREIRSVWTPETIAALEGAGVDDVHPIFIVGMPRSGSTLTEHVIEAHPAITSIGEGSVIARFFSTKKRPERDAFAKATRDAADELRRLAGPEGRLLDKFLTNYQRIGSLAAAFPNAKFIQTRRDPRAIALSIYSNPLSMTHHPYAVRLSDLGHYFVQQHLLMEYWKSILGDRIIVGDYRTLVEDPEPSIRDLIARLELPWDDACLHPEAVQKRVRTLSVVQVRSGIHSGSVERWRAYEDDLDEFTRIVSEVWDFGKD